MLVFCFHSILSLDHFVFSFFPSPPFLFTLVLWGVYCISPARNCAREIIAPGLRFLPFLPPSKGIGPYSIRFRNFFFFFGYLLFPASVTCSASIRRLSLHRGGIDGGEKTWADARCNWAEHFWKRNAGSVAFMFFRMSGVILCGVCYSMDIIQCHLRSLPTYYTIYLQLLPNIHILEIHQRACPCVSRLKCGTVYCFMYIAHLTTNTIAHVSIIKQV